MGFSFGFTSEPFPPPEIKGQRERDQQQQNPEKQIAIPEVNFRKVFEIGSVNAGNKG